MVIIISIIVAVYLLMIAWTWQSLESLEKTKKVVFIVIGIIISYIVTLIIFNISQQGVNYQNEITKHEIKKILVLLFTALNGVIFIPYIAKLFTRVKENEIEDYKLKKKIIILVIIFIICMFFENMYLKDIQNGIINIYNSIPK